MTPLSNENAKTRKLYKVYAVSRLYIMTVGHMAAKWGVRATTEQSKHAIFTDNQYG